MRLKITEFERFARARGYSNGGMLLKDFGCGGGTYGYFKRGGSIGCDLVTEIYNRYGEETFEFIDFEEDTLYGFKSKYIEIGNKLY